MNVLFSKLLNSTYRKEPISGFILILGAVDAVIGGVGGRWTLLSFGLVMVLSGALLRWYKVQKAESVVGEKPARYFLPPSQSRPPLPLLMKDKKR